jgi:hypothetical protein
MEAKPTRVESGSEQNERSAWMVLGVRKDRVVDGSRPKFKMAKRAAIHSVNGTYQMGSNLREERGGMQGKRVEST